MKVNLDENTDAYNDVFYRLEKKKKSLKSLEEEIKWLESDVTKYYSNVLYYTELYNELNSPQS